MRRYYLDHLLFILPSSISKLSTSYMTKIKTTNNQLKFRLANTNAFEITQSAQYLYYYLECASRKRIKENHLYPRLAQIYPKGRILLH